MLAPLSDAVISLFVRPAWFARVPLAVLLYVVSWLRSLLGRIAGLPSLPSFLAPTPLPVPIEQRASVDP